MDEKIRQKELEIIALMNKRGRIARDRNIEGETIPAKSLSVKLLQLSKVWSRRALNIDCSENPSSAKKGEAKALRGCREELLGCIEDVENL